MSTQRVCPACEKDEMHTKRDLCRHHPAVARFLRRYAFLPPDTPLIGDRDIEWLDELAAKTLAFEEQFARDTATKIANRFAEISREFRQEQFPTARRWRFVTLLRQFRRGMRFAPKGGVQ
jgi:hypothetical protein